jgi:dipeptidyl aminopeptidase/acylaminoacyl peptidase
MSLLRPAGLATLLFVAVTARPAVLTPEQAIKARTISNVSFSPDGGRLVCVISEPPKGDLTQSHVWMLDVASSGFRQITFSNKSENSPRWSPDGRTLAFLSTREERAQIYTLPMDGGEANALTTGKNAVSFFRWSPDGTEIAFLAPEPKSDVEEKKEKDKEDAKVADREQDLRRIWIVDLPSKKVRQVTRGAWRIDQFEWISNNRLIAVATNQPRAETWTTALFQVSTDDGTLTPFSQPKQPFGGLSVSPDLSVIAFVATHNNGPHPFDLFLQSTAGGLAHDATGRTVLGVKWRGGSNAFVSTAEGFGFGLYEIGSRGEVAPVKLPYAHGDFDVARDGTLAFVGFGFDRLPELFVESAGSAEAKQVSHVHENWEDITLASAEVFRFKSFDGMQIEAALMKPPGATMAPPATRYPLILYVHGGPAGNFSANFNPWAELLAARGYEVLMVNPRGSSGYSEQFLKANRSDWGGGDFKDLMAGVDAVLARGETDPNRVGIGGWSYGGYMAEWAITQTNRFKAAVSGAGMFDLAAEFGTENGPADDEWYFGTPWEHPERFAHNSPATYIRNAKTPTLILQGENDTTDPVGQSTALYRALKRYGVETELVIYPREPHGPREEKHRIDILVRMLDWFDRYLKNGSSANE